MTASPDEAGAGTTTAGASTTGSNASAADPDDVVTVDVLRQISEHLGRYVYLLVDPRTQQPFYVGKGQGLRAAAHEAEVDDGPVDLGERGGPGERAAVDQDGGVAVADLDTVLDDDVEDTLAGRERLSAKHAVLEQLRRERLAPHVWIVRHRLGEREYTSVEAAVIDVLMTFPVRDASKRTDAAADASGAEEPREPDAPGRQPLPARRQPLVDGRSEHGGSLTNARREATRASRRQDSEDRGLVSLARLARDYSSEPLTTDLPLLLITLGPWQEETEPFAQVTPGIGLRSGYGFRREWLDPEVRAGALDEVADSVRCWWRVDPAEVHRLGIRHIVAVHAQVTREVYEIVPGSWVRDVVPVRTEKVTYYRRGCQVRYVPRDDDPGSVWSQVVGQHGHRVPPRKPGEQGAVRYWPPHR